ncbi:alpha/beta-hydrolase [Fomitiporia mediterranea MF3/22]|uniref:alpha/beta-hydrolase n=1 Tax=Fomitiporia mediterranea (strain MF3/22) TaxID=694068 RepID=UPI0004408FF5|nr:alpha/beta-hydrolase [Fomitiporia mediterranea MF3/22]EJD03418.1 alpha/beta-hydrolase [Fomitiporia mediterranea MF3/22]
MALVSILTIQPFKGIYVGCAALGLLFIRIPYWTLRNLFPSWRPRASWTIRRCIDVNMTRYMMGLGNQVGGLEHYPSYKELKVGNGVNGVWIDAVPELITGDLKKWADTASIESIKIPGYWYHKTGEQINMDEAAKSDEKVILDFHGGGYMALSAHPSSSVSLVVRTVLAHSPSVRRALSVEYRLAAPGANSFPAQLIDGLAGYAYLVRKLGFKPENIILVGDSAGANLALALTRYLITHSSSLDPQLGKPGGLVLLSPWVDLTTSHATPGASVYANTTSDFLGSPPAKGPDFPSTVLAGPHGQSFLSNEYISPATRLNSSVSFKDFPRSIVVLGDAETLVDSIRTLEERMVKDMGKENVAIYEAKDAFHDFIGFDFFEPQRTEAAVEIGKWIGGL